MRSRKVICLLASAVLAVSCCGCDFVDALMGKDISVSQTDTGKISGRYDIDAVAERVDALQNLWEESGKEQELTDLIGQLLSDVDECYAIYAHAETEYHADWDSRSKSEREQVTNQDYSEVYTMIMWAFVTGYKKSSYSELFRQFIREEDIDYYLSSSLSRLRKAARSSTESNSEFLDAYYDLAYDNSLDPDYTNRECAKLYLENIKQYDTSDYYYQDYHRDYTAEQASGMYEKIVKDFVPVYRELTQYLRNSPQYLQIKMNNKAVTDPFDTILQYAPKLSPRIAESAEKLVKGKRYVTGSGENCYDGGYTLSLPSENDAWMYIFLRNDFSDFFSVVHEFGHYHADWRDRTPIALHNNCTDLAEVQSNGMEVLFTHYYPDIYGNDAKIMEILSLYNLMDSLVSGFAVGEFEYEVMKNKESFSEDDVVTVFNRIHEDADLGIELYQILHLFEQPGYYISYGVSALAALQIYSKAQTDYSAAIEQYEKIAETSSLDGSHLLMQTLEDAGFDNLFEDSTFEQILSAVRERINALK